MKKLFLQFYLVWLLLTYLFFFLPEIVRSSLEGGVAVTMFFIAIYLVVASFFANRIILNAGMRKKWELWASALLVVAFFLALVWYCRNFQYSYLLVAVFSTVSLILAATIAGVGLSSAIKHPAELVPVAITAAVADIASVAGGPTKSMAQDITRYYQGGMTGGQPLVDFFVIKVAVPGFGIPLPLFGVTDWILIALFSSALRNLGKNDNVFCTQPTPSTWLYIPITVIGLFLALIAASVTGIYIPAMLFISLSLILYLALRYKIHLEMRRKDLIYSLLFPAVVLGVFYIAVERF